MSKVLEKKLTHALVHIVRNDSGKPIGFIGVHRGSKTHPAFGATRIRAYTTLREALNDVLNLSELMSYKNALANLPYGGAKGVIIMTEEEQNDPKKRATILKHYTDAVNNLGGIFVTGADVGVSPEDVRYMRSHSPNIVGVERDPVLHTAHGVIGALRSSLRKYFHNDTIANYRYAVLGVGKVGGALVEYLAEQGAEVTISDIDESKVNELKRRFPKIQSTTPEELLDVSVDVFIPCALGGILNEETITRITAPIIVGAANNQLEEEHIGDLLHSMGKLYAPDYVANGGGLISVINEYEKADEARLAEQVLAIEDTMDSIFTRSTVEGTSTHRIADEIGRERIDALFPRTL